MYLKIRRNKNKPANPLFHPLCKKLSKFEEIRAMTYLTDSGAFEPDNIKMSFVMGQSFLAGFFLPFAPLFHFAS